jgi:hypothetical protein
MLTFRSADLLSLYQSFVREFSHKKSIVELISKMQEIIAAQSWTGFV